MHLEPQVLNFDAVSQTFLRVQEEESAASKLAEKDKLLRLLPRDRMYQV